MSEQLLKIAICDDLNEDRTRLHSLISNYLDKNNIYATIDEFSSGEDFLNSDTSIYMLVFMDIFMIGINGMETVKKLISQNPHVIVVFQTTSKDFAADAFSVSAFNYLIKPMSEEKLKVVLDRFLEHYYSVRTVTVKIDRIDEDIYLSDILYIEAKGKKTIIHTKHREYESTTSMAELCNRLPESDFCKPIRWAVVSMREIINMPSDKIELSDGTVIPISRNDRQKIKDRFADFKWKQMRKKLGVR